MQLLLPNTALRSIQMYSVMRSLPLRRRRRDVHQLQKPRCYTIRADQLALHTGRLLHAAPSCAAISTSLRLLQVSNAIRLPGAVESKSHAVLTRI
jgi:hypothetical protein